MQALEAQHAEAQRFAVLRLEHVSLLVPLQEVHSLESAAEIDASRRRHGSAGALAYGEDWLDVVCFSDELELQTALPERYRICALLADDEKLLTLACSAISNIDGGGLLHRPLPSCMRSKQSPVLALASRGEDVFCRTSVAALSRFLEQPR